MCFSSAQIGVGAAEQRAGRLRGREREEDERWVGEKKNEIRVLKESGRRGKAWSAREKEDKCEHMHWIQKDCYL